MIVTCGATWGQGSGKREYSIGLSDDDGRALLGEKWDGMSWAARRLFLEAQADVLVLKYMLNDEVISQEYFEERVNQVKRRGSVSV